jgi:hypothetical protein
MIVMLRRIYDVNCLVATLEPVLYERQQHAILFVIAVKKRADMMYFAKLRAGKGNWRRGLLHVYSSLIMDRPGDGTALRLICTLVAAPNVRLLSTVPDE